MVKKMVRAFIMIKEKMVKVFIMVKKKTVKMFKMVKKDGKNVQDSKKRW